MSNRLSATTEAAVANCPDCYSRGEVRIDCSQCSGCGKETCNQCGGHSMPAFSSRDAQWATCPHCEGTGREPCGACHGTGYNWGPCPTCETTGAVTPTTLAEVHDRQRGQQQQLEVERWESFAEASRRWDEEVDQWFADDLTLRADRRRRQREEHRRRLWKRWKRRMATLAIGSIAIASGVRWGEEGVELAHAQYKLYFEPPGSQAPEFTPSVRRLTKHELNARSAKALDALQQEILARHGLRMTRGDMLRRFRGKPWYRPDTTDYQVVWGRLSATEQYNLWLIAEQRALRQ